MSGLIAAAALFGAVYFIVTALRAEDSHQTDGHGGPRLPDPGPRDLHTVTPTTLGRAPVPRWT